MRHNRVLLQKARIVRAPRRCYEPLSMTPRDYFEQLSPLEINEGESTLAQAARHVRETAARVARQKGLIAELERDGHQDALPDAQELLRLLQESEHLATEHLHLEQAESGDST
jgi:hypothetical protein